MKLSPDFDLSKSRIPTEASGIVNPNEFQEIQTGETSRITAVSCRKTRESPRKIRNADNGGKVDSYRWNP